MERNSWVDYAKAIGIILVVYGHVAIGAHKAGVPMDEDSFQLVNSIIYSFHMPLFFFLSGLFFYSSFIHRGASGLLANKVDTILYPYVVWSLLQGSIEHILSSYTNGSVSIGEVLSFAWEPRAQFWFLYALFLIFVVSTAIYSIFDKTKTTFLIVLFGVLYCTLSYFPKGMLTQFILGNTVFFLMGIGFDKIKSVFERNYITLSVVLGILFIIGQYIFHGPLDLTYRHGGPAVLALSTVSILFVVAASICLSKLEIKWLVYIGASSMAIYLMHIIAGSGARVVLNKFLGVQSPSAHLVVGTLAGILAPLVALYIMRELRLGVLLAPPKSLSAEFFLKRRLQKQPV